MIPIFLLPLVTIVTLCVQITDVQSSACYDFFLKKDGCVHASADHPCSTTPNPRPVSALAFDMQPATKAAMKTANKTSTRLARRYDPTIPTKTVAGGNGACGLYDTDEQPGVCLYSGWVSGNCKKQVYIQRRNAPESVQYVPVLDGCDFGAQGTADGCPQVWVTKALFAKLNPTAEEQRSGQIKEVTWDFVQSPV